jgi:hypothetical protein
MNSFAPRTAVVAPLLGMLILAPAPASGVPVSRDDAIATVTTTIIDPHPLKDILYGYAFQDPVPPGTGIGQLSFDSFDSLGTAADSSWFFWLDFAPLASYAHPTRMVLVNAETGAIDLDVDTMWWPLIDGTTQYYHTPDRFLSPDIFVSSGIADTRRIRQEAVAPGEPVPTPERTDGVWGVIVSPFAATEPARAFDVNRMKTAFMSMGVDNPVVIAGKTRAETEAALQALPDDCSKLYVYWTGHGWHDQLWFPTPQGGSSGNLGATKFACDLAANKADEYCVILDTCGSGTFLDDFADKGLTGFHVTAAESGFAWATSTGQLFTFFLDQCWTQGFTGIEALIWAEDGLDAWWDSVATADPTKWGPTNADSTNHDPTGGYVGKLSGPGGTGSNGTTFTMAPGCSTVCIDIRPTPPVPPNPCGNFTLFCDAGGGWQKVATYNWTVNQNVYFRNTGVLPVRYNISMHANHLGANALITWEAGTQTPETPVVVNNFNAFTLGWVDGSSGEFNPVLGQGTNGSHFVPWFDGIFLDNLPATTGPQWFNDVTYDVPIEIDFSRPELYVFGDPNQGFEVDTSLLFFFEHVVDPFTGVPGGSAFFEATVTQPSLGTIGPFLGEFTDPGMRSHNTPNLPVVWNLGRIFPQLVTLTVTVIGPMAVQWDAIVMLPDDGVGTPAPLPSGLAPATRLYAAAPNPFRGHTRIDFEIDRPAHVRLSVFDVTGRAVSVLLDGVSPAGRRSIPWDGRDGRGKRVAAGVYYYRLEAPGIGEAKQVVRLR